MEIGERLRGAVTDHDMARHEGRIQGMEDEIDRLVYRLYGLTEEERGIVGEDRFPLPVRQGVRSSQERGDPLVSGARFLAESSDQG